MAIKEGISLLPETVLTITCDSVSYGRLQELPTRTGEQNQYPPQDIGPNEVIVLGPFNDTKKYRLTSVSGRITYITDFKGVDGVTSESVIQALSNATLELVNPANNDEILIKDSSDDGKLKAITVQSLVDLVGNLSGTSSALTSTITQLSHGLSVGNIVRLDNSGDYVKALASDEIQAEVIGVVSDVEDIDNFTITTQGKMSGLTGLIPGAVYFLSDLTSGDYILTEPYLPDTVIKPVFVAENATTIYIQNYIGQNND